MKENIAFTALLVGTMVGVWWGLVTLVPWPSSAQGQQSQWIEILVADDPYSAYEHGTLINNYLTTVDPSCIIDMEHEMAGRWASEGFFATVVERRC